MRTRQETTLNGAEQSWQHVPSARQAEQEEESLDRQRENASVAAQFGDVRPVATRAEQVWWRADENGVHGLPKATAIAIGLTYTLNAMFSSVIAYLLYTLPTFLLDRLGAAGIDMPTWLRWLFVSPYVLNDSRPWWTHLLPSLIMALPCVLAGAILARVVPRNAIRAAFRASITLLVIGLVSTLFSFLFMWRALHSDYLVSTLLHLIFMPLVLIAATWFFARRLRLDR